MKKKELIESLKRLAADVTAIAEALEGNEEAVPETPAAEQPLPEKRTYTFEEARARLARKVPATFRNGHHLEETLNSYIKVSGLIL